MRQVSARREPAPHLASLTGAEAIHLGLDAPVARVPAGNDVATPQPLADGDEDSRGGPVEPTVPVEVHRERDPPGEAGQAVGWRPEHDHVHGE